MVFLRIFTLKEAKTVFVMKLTLSWLGPVVRFESETVSSRLKSNVRWIQLFTLHGVTLLYFTKAQRESLYKYDPFKNNEEKRWISLRLFLAKELKEW